MQTTSVLLPPGHWPQLTEFARTADELGFHTLWVVEDCYLEGGVAQAATALAVTSRIGVGVGILPSASRHPAFAAMELATLANMYPGRVVAGLGHGMPAWMRQLGLWRESPLTLLGESLQATRELLLGRTVAMSGRYVTLRDVRLASPPSRPPKVLAGVRGPRSLRVAARHGDGVILAEPVTPEYLASTRAHLGDGFDGVVVAYAPTAVDAEPARARRRARRALRWVGEPDWAPHIAPLPFAADLAELRRSCGTPEEFADRLADEWVEQLAIAGDADTARARIGQLQRAGADEVVLVPTGTDPLAELASLASAL